VKIVKGSAVRILGLTTGTRGDVEPFVALARRALRAGHDVRLGVNRDAVELVERAGVEAVALDCDVAGLVAAQGVSPMAALRSYRRVVAPMMRAMLLSAARSALEHRPDVLVHHPKVLSAPLAAARLGIPHVLAEIVPAVTPTREFPMPAVPIDLGPVNRLTYRAADVADAMFAGALREVRAHLGLPRRGGVSRPARSLVAVSPALLPRPADWPDTSVLTGAWQDGGDDPVVLDPELEAFVDAGDVVIAGFGSMAAGDPVERGRAVVAGARAAGLRVLVTTGWGGITVPDDLRGSDVLVRRDVPHAGVLPRCAAAVHHGGAGTVHATVRAGVPSVVVPFLGDQPFWARLLHRRGLAAAPVLSRRLTADRLATALANVPDPAAVREAARRMDTEDGCGAALEAIGEVG
jgi:sterol 3beta-glucosyltransferase